MYRLSEQRTKQRATGEGSQEAEPGGKRRPRALTLRSKGGSSAPSVSETAWAEPRPHARIEALHARREPRSRGIILRVVTAHARPGDLIRAVLLNAEDVVGEAVAYTGSDLSIPVPPGTLTTRPPAYTLRVSLIREGRRIDVVDCFLGSADPLKKTATSPSG